MSTESTLSDNKFIGIFTRFQHDLKRFILGRIADPTVAEDVLQEVFIKIHSHIDTLTDESRIESWIFQIARNAIIDYYRTRKSTEEIKEWHQLVEALDDQKAAERLAPAIRKFIDQLPKPYREVLLLVEYQGMSQRELSVKLGLSSSGAKSRVQRGRAMLKDMLMRCCHFEFDRYGTLVDYHEISCCCCKEDHDKR